MAKPRINPRKARRNNHTMPSKPSEKPTTGEKRAAFLARMEQNGIPRKQAARMWFEYHPR